MRRAYRVLQQIVLDSGKGGLDEVMVPVLGHMQGLGHYRAREGHVQPNNAHSKWQSG